MTPDSKDVELERVGRSNPLMLMTLLQIGLLFSVQFLPRRYRMPIITIVGEIGRMMTDEHALITT